MVLRCVLEHLLSRARRSRREHHSARGDRQQSVFTDRVGEVLRDVRRELVGRLVTVEPRRHSQAVLAAWEALEDVGTNSQILVRAMEIRLQGEHLDRLTQRRVRVRSEPRAKVCRLHRPRATAGRHVPSFAGHRSPQLDDDCVRIVGPEHRVAAHDGHHLRPIREMSPEGVIDRVIVKPLRKRIEDRDR